MPGPGFAVIDFETTGLFPGGHDRVIEVAIVHTDASGRVTGQWETLINPGRDLGRQDIHRIRAADILDAPSFDEIAAEFLDLLSGRVIVAHNASFDTRFLIAELKRIGYEPDLAVRALCTMQLAREFLPGSGRSLADCCAAYDIELVDAHRASVDALATARLLEAYIGSTPMWNGWSEHLSAAAGDPWPPHSGPRAPWRPRASDIPGKRLTSGDFLHRITHKLPEYGGPAQHLDYLALLDTCLLDRSLSAHEANALVALAEELGIGRETCARLHHEYFLSLGEVAWADGVLTTDEIADLAAVGALLEIPAEDVARAMQQGARSPSSDRPNTEQRVGKVSRFALERGDRVVLTGEMTRPRSSWHEELVTYGYVPCDAVTKKVKLLVAADPDTLSGKAKKARDYGIPVVSEHGLVQLLNG